MATITPIGREWKKVLHRASKARSLGQNPSTLPGRGWAGHGTEQKAQLGSPRQALQSLLPTCLPWLCHDFQVYCRSATPLTCRFCRPRDHAHLWTHVPSAQWRSEEMSQVRPDKQHPPGTGADWANNPRHGAEGRLPDEQGPGGAQGVSRGAGTRPNRGSRQRVESC